MKRTPNDPGQPGAQHPDDHVSEKRLRLGLGYTLTSLLPEVNKLIPKGTLNYTRDEVNKDDANILEIFIMVLNRVRLNPRWKKVLEGRYDDTLSCSNFAESNRDMIIECAKTQDYTKLFSEQGGLLISPHVNDNQIVEVRDSIAATESSWNTEFKGNGAAALFNYMRRNFGDADVYARYLAIVQSSGMGKSRLVDELSKNHFVVPICLRKQGTKGFPPADEEVRDFLLDSGNNEEEAGERSNAFLTALGYELLGWLNKSGFLSSDCSLAQIAHKFRIYMTEGMKSTSHNLNRVTFYSNIIERSHKLISRVAKSPAKDNENSPPQPMFLFEPSPDAGTSSINKPLKVDATMSLRNVMKVLAQFLGYNDKQPIIIFAYDEAHALTKPFNDSTQLSRFTELRRAIRGTRSISTFSLFLSTTGKVFQFGGSSEQDPSSRIQDGTLRLLYPFTDLSFDLFASDFNSTPAPGLEFFASIDYIVSLGRPLFFTRYNHGNDNLRRNIIRFAAQKLLGIDPDTIAQQNLSITRPQSLACLSVRLDLSFQPMNPEPEVELTQIENHMRVCLEVNDSFDHVESIAASEPLLAEAAAGIMMSGLFHPVEALISEFRRPQIERGERGEVVIALMQLLVRDKILKMNSNSTRLSTYSINLNRIIKVVDFLQEFFVDCEVVKDAAPSCVCSHVTSNPSQALPINPPFSKMFAKSHCYFSHFIKVTEHSQVKQSLLLGLALRGASIICANCMPGVDIITPFLYWDTKVEKTNLSVILWQCKNDRKYGKTPNKKLFDAMDPYRLKIFNSQNAPPIIRIVTALAAPTLRTLPGLVNVTNQNGSPATSSFTSYDFWAYGFDEGLYKVLGYPPIEGGGALKWNTLLDVSIVSKAFQQRPRNTEEMIAIRQHQHPGRSSDIGHYSWCKQLLQSEDDTVSD